MSFFRRDEEHATPPAHRPAAPSTTPGARAQAVTRIAEGTRITGEISGSTELLIEGEVDGRIRLDGRVVVGKAGGVRGEITGRSVLIAGRVEGDVKGSERVEVGGTGRLDGDIAAPRVTIAEGAFFKGQVEMRGDAGARSKGEAPEQRPAAAARTSTPAGSGREESPGLFPAGSSGAPAPAAPPGATAVRGAGDGESSGRREETGRGGSE